MPMITTLTLAYEGAPSCIDCQRVGEPVCAHVGLNEDGWTPLVDAEVHVTGLDPDPAFKHYLREVKINPDRKIVTLTVETQRPPKLDLVRNLSVRRPMAAPKCMVRAMTETGEMLIEGAYDAPLQPGQEVHVAGKPYTVTAVDNPNRGPGGACDGEFDWHVTTLRPDPLPEPIRSVYPVAEAGA